MTKIKLHLVSLVFLIASSAFSQSTTVSVNLAEKEFVLDAIALQKKGLVIKTGKDKINSKDLDWKLAHYSPDLKLLWQIPLAKDQINKGFGNSIVASEYTEYIYHFEPKGYNVTMGASSIFLTQIDGAGKTKTTELQNTKEYGDRECTFSGKDYLILLTSQDGNVKKGKRNLVLNKISHSDFAYSNVTLPLPLENPTRDESDWQIIAYNADRLYVGSKKIALTENKKDKTAKYTIYELDFNGKQLRKAELDVTGDNFLCPSRNAINENGARFINDGFSTEFVDGRPKILPTLWAYGAVKIDDADGSLYVYGLTHSKADPATFSGYTIQKFDWTGKRLWKEEKSFGQDVDAAGYLIKDGGRLTYHLGSLSNVYFTNNADKTIKLEVFIANKAFIQTYSNDGKLLSSESVGADAKISLKPKDEVSRADFKIRKLAEQNAGLKAHVSSISPESKGYLYEFDKGNVIRKSENERAVTFTYFANNN